MKDLNCSSKENFFDIAIIGMSARFPGADSVDEFWRNLASGVESISFFSEDELKEFGIDPAILDKLGAHLCFHYGRNHSAAGG